MVANSREGYVSSFTLVTVDYLLQICIAVVENQLSRLFSGVLLDSRETLASKLPQNKEQIKIDLGYGKPISCRCFVRCSKSVFRTSLNCLIRYKTEIWDKEQIKVDLNKLSLEEVQIEFQYLQRYLLKKVRLKSGFRFKICIDAGGVIVKGEG